MDPRRRGFRGAANRPGRAADAQRIFEGYIGTVHSVCARLLSDYAIDAGLSPAVEVLPEGEETSLFRIAVAELAELYTDELEPVAERLELTESGSGYARQPDWRNVYRYLRGVAGPDS